MADSDKPKSLYAEMIHKLITSPFGEMTLLFAAITIPIAVLIFGFALAKTSIDIMKTPGGFTSLLQNHCYDVRKIDTEYVRLNECSGEIVRINLLMLETLPGSAQKKHQ